MLICGLIFSAAGCVSIYDNVNVQKPETVDQFQRNVLDKCTPHTLPHRLILAQMSASNPSVRGGEPIVNDQQTFDNLWNSIQPLSEADNNVPSFGLKPVVNWSVQSVYFYAFYFQNSCEKVKPLAMETDCYHIYLTVYKYLEGKDCSAPITYPVFVYILPKTPLPIEVNWSSSPNFNPTPQP